MAIILSVMSSIGRTRYALWDTQSQNQRSAPAVRALYLFAHLLNAKEDIGQSHRKVAVMGRHKQVLLTVVVLKVLPADQ